MINRDVLTREDRRHWAGMHRRSDWRFVIWPCLFLAMCLGLAWWYF